MPEPIPDNDDVRVLADITAARKRATKLCREWHEKARAAAAAKEAWLIADADLEAKLAALEEEHPLFDGSPIAAEDAKPKVLRTKVPGVRRSGKG